MFSGINIRAEMTFDVLTDLALSGIIEITHKVQNMDLMVKANQKSIEEDTLFIRRLYERLEKGEYIDVPVERRANVNRDDLFGLSGLDNEKQKRITIWMRRCYENLFFFRNKSSELKGEERAEFIQHQYSLLFSINNVITGKARLVGGDQFMLDEETASRDVARWQRLKEEYYRGNS